MKRVYTKPTVEGELFTANEYIASCWLVSCKNNTNETFITYTEPNPGYQDGDSYFEINGDLRYYGSINSNSGEKNESATGNKFWDWVLSWFGIKGQPYHQVTVTSGLDVDTSNYAQGHPNASN